MQVEVDPEAWLSFAISTADGLDAMHLRWVMTFLVCGMTLILRRRLLRSEHPSFNRRLKRVLGSVWLLVSGTAVLFIWRGGLVPHTGTMLGLMVAALTVALTPPLQNFAGGLHVRSRQLYAVGDLVEVAGLRGRVVEIGALSTTLMLHDETAGSWLLNGPLVHVPHARVLSEHVANTSAGLGMVPFSVSLTLTYGSDWREAKRAIERILNRLFDADTSAQAVRRLSTSHGLALPSDGLLPSVTVDLADSGVVLTARGYARMAEHRELRSRLAMDALSWIEGESAVDLAYPTIALSDASSAPSLPAFACHEVLE